MTQNTNLNISYAENKEAQSYMALVRNLLAAQQENPPLAYLHSFGCQQSVADGEKLMGLLASMGYGFTQTSENADFILFNTCAVRETAEQRVYGFVGALKHLKKARPQMIIAMAGCMTERREVAEKLRKSYPYVDLVLGTNAFSQLPRLVYEKLTLHKRFIHEGESTRNLPIEEGIPTHREGRIKAWVPVMYGCDNFCSYCIVPYVRGRERSRESSAILEEVRQLVAEGYKEITLLGQNVNSYGKGNSEGIHFAELLRRINGLEGDFILRFMTSHPKDCTHELLDAMADCNKVAKQLHLPVQCGSDRILAEMNRRYTTAQYLELIDYARARMPGLSITSDIIVGFPGECYEDFQQTLDLIKQVEYTSLFTFIYSKRSGTRAEQLPDPVPYADKSLWLRELLTLQDGLGQRVLNRYLGRTLRVLVEAVGHGGTGTLVGRSDGNILVELPGDSSLLGRFIQVKITGDTNCVLIGEPLIY